MISGHFGWGEAGWGESGVVTVVAPEVLNDQWMQGSVDLVQGSVAVEGVGTDWSGNIAPGQLLLVLRPGDAEAAVVYQIATVVDDDSLTLAAPWQGETVNGMPYLVHRRTGSLPRLRRIDEGVAPLMTYTLAAIDRGLALGQPPGPVGDWLLATGAWNDAGHWDDTENWQDS